MRIKTHKQAVKAAQQLVIDYSKEHAIGLYLDAKLQLLTAEVISVGTVTNNFMHPREVFKPAVIRSAVTVIVLHNHPTGVLTASAEDRKITTQLVKAGEIMGIKFADHIIFDVFGNYNSLLSKEEGGD